MSNDDNLPPSKRPFGLSFPSKPKSKLTTTNAIPINKNSLAASAFSLDDDDDMDSTPPTKMTKPPGSSRSVLNPKAQRDIEQALEEDPNIYEYDEVYEQVSSTVQQEQKREEKKRLELQGSTVRQPKYVAGLLEKNKIREKEYERVQERKIQRERELEGDMYADKEVFVTSGYKAKLAERQADIEREKLEDKREALLNVFHQDNMDAFYRFQFKVRTGDVTILEESEKVKTASVESKPSRNARQLRSRTDNDDEPMESNDMYARAREKATPTVKVEDEEQTIDEKPKPTAAVKVRRINDATTQAYDDEQIDMGPASGEKKKKKKQTEKENDLADVMPIASEKKRHAEETRIERIRRLCEKRTVGEVLQAAQQAYFERQQKRELFKDYIEKIES